MCVCDLTVLHIHLCMSIIFGVWNAQDKGQMSQHTDQEIPIPNDIDLFVPLYDITMEQPYELLMLYDNCACCAFSDTTLLYFAVDEYRTKGSYTVVKCIRLCQWSITVKLS